MFIEDMLQYFKWIDMKNINFLKDFLRQLESGTKEDIVKSAKEIYKRDINFAELCIVLDRLSFEVNDSKQYVKNRDIFAQAYLKERLPKEVEILKKGIHNNPSLVSSKDLDTIDELLNWLTLLVDSFLSHKASPNINGRFEKFKTFIKEKEGVFFDDKEIKENFLKINKGLYETANICTKFYENKEYFYFMLSFVDLMSQFLKMVTLLGGMFLESELLSIYIDPITFLPNRFQLIKDINTINNCYIMIVNIIGFSRLNILYGFETGDILLKRIATFLQPRSIKSYRIYGDEFAIIINNEEEAKRLYDNLNHLEIKINSEKIDLYFYGAYAKFENKALELCEFALSKSDKKSLIDTKSVEKYIDSYKKDLTISQKLKDAMIKDNIIPYYQPIYVTKPNNKVLKYEVLMRVDFDGEILSPAQFIDVLRTLPIYVEFTKSMLLKSFELFKNNDLTFSVNFTLTDIKDKNLVKFLKVLIDKYPQTAKRLTIEIIESEALDEYETINSFIENFKKYGISFALDDFGSGYSNFTQVAKLNIDFIKIDGSIINELLENKKIEALFESIITFSKNFELDTIAEFVSSKELFEYLKDKVNMMQGFYIGKPEPFLISQ